MSTVEIVLTIIGIIMMAIGITTMFVYDEMCSKDIYNLSYIVIIFTILGFILVSIGVVSYQLNTTEIVKEDLIITIDEKYKNHRFVGVAGKGGHSVTDYYVIFDNNKIKVSKSTYEKYSVGDEIMINETIKYKIDRVSKERQKIISVTYN